MAYTVTSFDHTADKGIIVRGDTLADVYAGAAVGMFGGMYALDDVQTDRSHKVVVTASDRELLLVAWLQELIFLFEVEEEIYSEVEVHEISDTSLRATVRGRTIGPDLPQIGAAVKAVTYHGLSLRPLDNGWEATLLFDV